jgi:hypothetical protein
MQADTAFIKNELGTHFHVRVLIHYDYQKKHWSTKEKMGRTTMKPKQTSNGLHPVTD